MLREKLKKVKLPNPVGVERFVQEIVENLAPSSVILHGSAAKGTFVDKLSDIDIIVISAKFSDIDPKNRFTHLLELAQKHRLRVEAFGYTPQEFLKMIKRLNFFAPDVVYYGLRLHDENGFWDKACEAFKKVQKKYTLKKQRRVDGPTRCEALTATSLTHVLSALDRFASSTSNISMCIL